MHLYNNEPLETLESFKYLRLQVSLNHIDRMNVLYITYRGQRKLIMHLRTNAMVEKLNVTTS